jgi:hypothetical protein
VPFKCSSASETLMRHMTEAPDPSRLSAIPAPIANWVLRCLDKDPSQRPSTMIEAETLLCEAQTASGIRTAWDDQLALPPIYDPQRKRRLERAFARRITPKTKGLVAMGVVAALTTSLLLLLIR